MVKVDRTVGYLMTQESDGAYIESVNSIEDGSACAGCEEPISEDEGVECYCAVEEISRTHEQYKWCTQDCFNKTHEEYHPDPYDWDEGFLDERMDSQDK